MKRLLFCFLYLILSEYYIFAQNTDALFIYRNDSIFNAFAFSEIIDISYDFVDGDTVQIIRTEDSICKIPLNKIDSINFKIPTTIIMQIPEEDLNGWSIGYSLGNEYIVAYIDTIDDIIVTLINQNGGSLEDGLVMCFDNSGNVVSVGQYNQLYDVRYDSTSIILYRVNDSGYFEEESIPISEGGIFNFQKQTKNVGSAWNLISRGASFLDNINSANFITNDVLNWNWKQLLQDGIVTAGSFLIGRSNPVVGFIVTVGQWPIDFYRKQNEERQRSAMFKTCTITIDEVRPENGNSVVYATVRGADLIDDYLVNMYNMTESEETRNLVSCGIVVRTNNQYTTTHLNDYISQEIQLNGEISFSSEIHLQFTIPGLNLTNNNSTYYFRSYLKSTRLKQPNGDVREGHIKYGNTFSYTAFDGEIISFVQNSANAEIPCHCCGGRRVVRFNTTIQASVNNVTDNIEQWGIYIISENGYRTRFPVDSHSVLNNTFDINIMIKRPGDGGYDLLEFDIFDINNCFAKKNVEIGVYKKISNPLGNYDYDSYIYSMPQTFELIYQKQPAITFSDPQIDSSIYIPQNTQGYNRPYTIFWPSVKVSISGLLFVDFQVTRHYYYGGWNTNSPFEICTSFSPIFVYSEDGDFRYSVGGYNGFLYDNQGQSVDYGGVLLQYDYPYYYYYTFHANGVELSSNQILISAGNISVQ